MSSPSRRPARLRAATGAVFLVAGLGIGAWAACLPSLKRAFALSDAELGLALFGFAAGAMLTMPFVGRVVMRLGSAPLSIAAAGGFALFLGLAPQAPDLLWLTLVVAAAGACFGTLDVAMNTHATLVERAWGRMIMSSFHALFSIGNLAGAGLAGFALAHGLEAAQGLPIAAAVVAALLLLAAPFLGLGRAAAEPEEESATPARRRFALPGRPLLVLGGLAFLSFLAEGAITDWSAVYAATVVGTAESTAALAYGVFATTMTLGRVVGDRIAGRIGAIATVRSGAALVALSLVLALAVPSTVPMLVAFALAGFGIANLIPVLFAVAGRTGGGRPGINVSTVAAMGYAGMLLGPPLIGLVAEAAGLRTGLGVVVLAVVVVGLGAGRLAAEPEQTAS